MNVSVQVWRQEGPEAPGRFVTYQIEAEPQYSLLDLLDRINENLGAAGEEPIAYESDCREGICGACGFTVDGVPHGPVPNTPACRQHVRGLTATEITIEPLRSAAFPVLRDLIVDRSALTSISMAGGTVRVDVGTAPDADAQPVSHEDVELALDFAACIGCGACVAACPNGAAHLFAGAKLAHLSLLPQAQVERSKRAKQMLSAVEEHFGPCSGYGECAKVCPAGIDLVAVAALQRERFRSFFSRA